MTKPVHILYVDDSRLDRALVRRALMRADTRFVLDEVPSWETFSERIGEGAYDLVLSDFHIAGFEGLQVLEAVHARDASLPVIIVTGTGNEMVAVEAMKHGATDYVIKTPHHIQRLPHAIDAALEKRQLALEAARHQEHLAYQAGLLQRVSDAIISTDPAFAIQTWNRAAEHIYGWRADEVVGEAFADVVTTDFGDGTVDQLVDELYRTGHWQGEVVQYRRNGTPLNVYSSVSVLRDAEGRVQGTVAVNRDVTERTQAEQALQESEAQYRALVEQSGDPIYVLQDDRFRLVNKAWERLFGYTRAEALDPSFDLLTLVAPASRDEILARRARRMAGEPVPSTYEFEAYTREGETRIVETRIAEVMWQGRPARQGVYRDVTERRQAEKALRRYAERLEVLRTIDRTFLDARSSETVAEDALRHLAELVPYDRACVLLFSEFGGVPTVLSTYGEAPDLSEASAEQSWVTTAVERIDALDATTACLPEAAFLPDSAAFLKVPLVVYGEAIGVLCCAAPTPSAFDAQHVAITRDVGEQLSVAIHSARLFEQVEAARNRLQRMSGRLVEVQEQERRHIALELHDEIGQILTGLSFSIDAALGALPADENAFSRVRGLVDALTERVRALSLELRPTMLDDLGLLPALLWHVRRYTEQTGVAVAFQHYGVQGQRFDSSVETAAYRIVQEALTNVARHAEVEEVHVDVWARDGRLHLRVKDEGRGFDPSEGELEGASIGVAGMQERAHLVGGTFTLDAAVGVGTRIEVCLPTEPTN